MDINHTLLHQAEKLLKAMDKTVDSNLPKEIADIVKFHSKGATAAALGSAWIPGAGGTAAVLACAGFIWTMYGRIGAKIDLPISSNVLKTLAFGVATNLASAAIAGIVVSSALSLIPGLGSVGASVIMGGVCYGLTLASGFVYLKVMTALFTKGLDPTKLSEDDLKSAASDAAKDSDVKDILKQARKDFKSEKANGGFERKCPQGHAVSPAARFCSECGYDFSNLTGSA